jgi:hypothetical protein
MLSHEEKNMPSNDESPAEAAVFSSERKEKLNVRTGDHEPSRHRLEFEKPALFEVEDHIPYLLSDAKLDEAEAETLNVDIDAVLAQLREDIEAHNFSPGDIQPIEAERADLVQVNLYEALPELQDAPDIAPKASNSAPKADAPRRPLFALPKLNIQLELRAVASFLLFAIVFVSPLHAMQHFASAKSLQDEALQLGGTALAESESGLSALAGRNYDLAAFDFERANSVFSELDDQVSAFQKDIGLIASLIPSAQQSLSTSKALITTGQSLSEVGSLLSLAAADLEESNSSLTERLNLLNAHLEEISVLLAQAAQYAEDINPTIIPENQREAVSQLTSFLPAASASMQEISARLPLLREVLGGDEAKTYLFLFQNTAELRPTGGFIGSYSEITLDEGAATHIVTPDGGSYANQGQLTEFSESPRPLQLINARWELQDANWFPDFRLSADKILDFYDAAGGPTVDGVIAINSDVLPELLALTGPIALSDGREFTAENVLFELRQNIDEANKVEGSAPKGIIGELLPKVLTKLTDSSLEDALKLMSLLVELLDRKSVQLYATDMSVQRTIENYGWSGMQKHAPGDELQVISTNIGGGKTDIVINQEVELDVHIQNDGSIFHKVTVRKTHRGIPTAQLEGANNVDYMRLYVPRGARLISASGFEVPDEELFEDYPAPLVIDDDYSLITSNLGKHPESGTDVFEENGKTVFGNWIQTKPGEIEEANWYYDTGKKLFNGDGGAPGIIRSVLNVKDMDRYSLLIQPQSGTVRDMRVKIHVPANMRAAWSSHDADSPIELTIDSDELLQFVLERYGD